MTQRLQRAISQQQLNHLRNELALHSVRYNVLKSLTPREASQVYRKSKGKPWKFDELLDDMVGKRITK